MNAYDNYAQALSMHELAFRLAEQTGYVKVRNRAYAATNKALKRCIAEMPERLLTHTVSGCTTEDYDNTDYDEAAEKYFKGKPICGDSESGMLCIRCSGEIVKDVMAFLRKRAEFEDLYSRKDREPFVQGLYNWTDAQQYCAKKKIAVKLELTPTDRKEIKKLMEEKKHRIMMEAADKAIEAQMIVEVYAGLGEPIDAALNEMYSRERTKLLDKSYASLDHMKALIRRNVVEAVRDAVAEEMHRGR